MTLRYLSMPRSFRKGIYAPLPTFFDEKEEIDIESYKKHVKFVAEAGATPTVCGSLGEAMHLDHMERSQLVKAAREALDEAGLSHIPILAGIAANSTREVIQYSKEVAAAGADFALLIPPAYYAKYLENHLSALKHFYVDVAAKSPIPIIMYNFPALSGGIDMQSELIIEIAKEAPNIAGIKLTCRDVGKQARITSVVHTNYFKSTYARTNTTEPFMIIDGLIDSLLPSMSVGCAATMPALADFVPKACVHFWNLCQPESLSDAKKLEEAQYLQGIFSQADGLLQPMGIPGVKMVVSKLYGYPGKPRRPLEPFDAERIDAFLGKEPIKILLDLESKV